jgi:DNA repair exonuclease SbcCD ATPase subunit
MEDKEKQLKKLERLSNLENEPNLSLYEELSDLNDKMEALQGVLSEINSKEVKTYSEELETLHNAILSLTRSVIDKDTVVNIPLDQLSSQLVKVEQAIKNIKLEKTEFPKELNLNEDQLNALLLEIQAIPPFPYQELEKLILGIGKKISDIKLEIPEQEQFDYDRLDRKFNELVRAVKNVSITVSSGGGGIDDVSRQNLTNISNNTSSIAGLSIPAHDYIAATYPTTSQEVYTYKTGGASGIVVGVITVNYTDATKTILSSVVKS